jgi:hypothetical protein
VPTGNDFVKKHVHSRTEKNTVEATGDCITSRGRKPPLTVADRPV